MLPKTLADVPADCIEPMNDEQSCQFRRYHSLEQKYSRPFSIHNHDIIDPLKNNPTMRLIHERVVEWGHAEITTVVAIFISFLAGHRNALAGKSILWAYTVVSIFHRNERIVTMNDLANEFRWGFPNEEGIMHVWSQQKCIDDANVNALDDPCCWMAENFFAAAMMTATA